MEVILLNHFVSLLKLFRIAQFNEGELFIESYAKEGIESDNVQTGRSMYWTHSGQNAPTYTNHAPLPFDSHGSMEPTLTNTQHRFHHFTSVNLLWPINL